MKYLIMSILKSTNTGITAKLSEEYFACNNDFVEIDKSNKKFLNVYTVHINLVTNYIIEKAYNNKKYDFFVVKVKMIYILGEYSEKSFWKILNSVSFDGLSTIHDYKEIYKSKKYNIVTK